MQIKVKQITRKTEGLKLELNRMKFLKTITIFLLSLFFLSSCGSKQHDLGKVIQDKNDYEELAESNLMDYYNDGANAYSLLSIKGKDQDSLVSYRLRDNDFDGFVMGEYKSTERALLKSKYDGIVTSLYTEKSDSSFSLLYEMKEANINFHLAICHDWVYFYDQKSLEYRIRLSDIKSDSILKFAICNIVFDYNEDDVDRIDIVVKRNGFNNLILSTYINYTISQSITSGDFEFYFNEQSLEKYVSGFSTQMQYVDNAIESIIHYNMFEHDLEYKNAIKYYEGRGEIIPRFAILLYDFSYLEG